MLFGAATVGAALRCHYRYLPVPRRHTLGRAAESLHPSTAAQLAEAANCISRVGLR
jgi:hypothetical protein